MLTILGFGGCGLGVGVGFLWGFLWKVGLKVYFFRMPYESGRIKLENRSNVDLIKRLRN